jgi:hypothetical protein
LQNALQNHCKSLGCRKDAQAFLQSSKINTKPLQNRFSFFGYETVASSIAKSITLTLQIYSKTIDSEWQWKTIAEQSQL